MRILLALGVLALAACGSDETKTQLGDTIFTENKVDGTVSIENEKGMITTSEGAAAAQTKFPAFAPQYPASTIEAAIKSAGKDKKPKSMVSFTTSDSLEKIATFYRAQFAEQGMKIGMNMLTEESVMISAEASEKKASVLASIIDGKTSGTLTFSGE